MLDHVREVHKGVKHVCDEMGIYKLDALSTRCGRQFPNIARLNRHKKHKHSD